MLIEQELARQTSEKDTVLTIGVFDGVHLGHKHLLAQLKEQARRRNSLSGVITFRQHPQELISPQTRLPYLTSLTERINLLKAEGVDRVVTLTFNRELAGLSARQFISLLRKYLKMSWLVVGPDFALGKEREGEANYLRKLGEEMGFGVSVVPPITVNSDVVSSTAIRYALAGGDMKRVRNLAGRHFSLTGPVVTGVGRGRELGFPTANLDIDPKQALPPDGVYATLAYIDSQVYQSLTSIGVRPTFDDGHRTIEVYILDYQGNLYGQELKVEFIERLREEKRFGTVEELKKQIAEDVKQGRTVLSSLGKK